MPATLTRLAQDRSGAAAIEYALMVALIFLAILAGMNATGVSLGNLYRGALDLIAAALLG